MSCLISIKIRQKGNQEHSRAGFYPHRNGSDKCRKGDIRRQKASSDQQATEFQDSLVLRSPDREMNRAGEIVERGGRVGFRGSDAWPGLQTIARRLPEEPGGFLRCIPGQCPDSEDERKSGPIMPGTAQVEDFPGRIHLPTEPESGISNDQSRGFRIFRPFDDAGLDLQIMRKQDLKEVNRGSGRRIQNNLGCFVQGKTVRHDHAPDLAHRHDSEPVNNPGSRKAQGFKNRQKCRIKITGQETPGKNRGNFQLRLQPVAERPRVQIRHTAKSRLSHAARPVVCVLEIR